MKNLIKLYCVAAGGFALSLSFSLLTAQEATSLSGLLDLVENDRVAESEEYVERLREFEQNATRQQEILDTTKERILEQERTQGQLSDQFEANEIIISDKREILRDRRGDLNELFGTLQGVAGDFLSNFQNSLISAQFPGRSEEIEGFIEKAGSTIDQLNISEIERFWFFMQQEMTESARVVTYNGEVATPSGDLAALSVTRIGSFNSIADGQYLSYSGDIGHLQILPRQPASDLLSGAGDLQGATSGFTSVAIDPTGGVGGSYCAARRASGNGDGDDSSFSADYGFWCWRPDYYGWRNIFCSNDYGAWYCCRNSNNLYAHSSEKSCG